MPDSTHLADRLQAELAQAGALPNAFVVDVRSQCASSNTELLALAEAGAPSGSVLWALDQTAGRGRRHRAWLSAPADSLTFSLLWRFAPGTSPLGLSLAVGVAIVRALRQVGAGGTASLALKWPNDVLLDGQKLAGVLVELVPGAPHAAVIGIGINRRLPTDLPPEVRALAAALPVEVAPERLLALLLIHLGRVLEEFGQAGFVALREEWQRQHAFQDALVRIDEGGDVREGYCRGVDLDGALRLETATGIERILAGDVSLRRA